MKRKKINSMARLLFLAIVLLGIITGFFLARKSQYFASLALTPPSIGEVKMISEEDLGGITKVNLVFRTGVNQNEVEPISVISLRFRAPLLNARGIQVVDEDGEETLFINPNQELIDSGEWEFPVNKIEIGEDELIIDFAAVYTEKDGYASYDYKSLATFDLKGVGSTDVFSFEFDRQLSAIYSKRRPVTNIWDISF
jgi:hypothetical protein